MTANTKSQCKVKPESITFHEYIIEGYYTKPAIDREKYSERDGLECPFSGDNGKVYYYDPKEGKYYDPDTDFYLSHDEYEATQHSQAKRTELMQQQRDRDFARRR